MYPIVMTPYITTEKDGKKKHLVQIVFTGKGDRRDWNKKTVFLVEDKYDVLQLNGSSNNRKILNEEL